MLLMGRLLRKGEGKGEGDKMGKKEAEIGREGKDV